MPHDGLLVIDKPEGPTSHDVVARLRRVLREKRIGHTGTLDPLATGVLPLVIGQATRLARFLASEDKRYTAVVRLGQATTTYDRLGEASGPAVPVDALTREAVEAALEVFRGLLAQVPPAYSAKKVAGVAAYTLARRGEAATLAPVAVTVHELSLIDMAGRDVTLDVHASAGFYVRSLAHDLGQALGCGAHLITLRRTASGTLTLADAVSLASLEADPARIATALRPLSALLPGWPAVTLTEDGLRLVRHGARLGPEACRVWLEGEAAGRGAALRHDEVSVRVLGPDGALVALAACERSPTGAIALHPRVVLV